MDWTQAIPLFLLAILTIGIFILAVRGFISSNKISKVVGLVFIICTVLYGMHLFKVTKGFDSKARITIKYEVIQK